MTMTFSTRPQDLGHLSNILGQKVRTLVESPLPAGYHTIPWNGNDETGKPVGPGISLYRLTAGDLAETKKMVLLKYLSAFKPAAEMFTGSVALRKSSINPMMV